MASTTSPLALLAITSGVTGAAWSSGICALRQIGYLLNILNAGVIASLSLIGCPTALGLSGHSAAAAAWAGLYNHGIAIMPKIAVIVATSHLYAAYDSGQRGLKFTGYVAAAVLAVSIIPYTILTMRPTNDKLLSVVAGTDSQGLIRDVPQLVNRWAALNLGRSVLPLASAIVGFATFYENVS